MSHSVLKLPQSVIERMKSHYRSDITSLSVQGAVFQAKPQGCTITAYKSGKVLFQGKTPKQKPDGGRLLPKHQQQQNPLPNRVPLLFISRLKASAQCLSSARTKSAPEITSVR